MRPLAPAINHPLCLSAVFLATLLTSLASAWAGGSPISGTGDGTGEKPQSKLWWNDQTWWAILTRSGHGLHFYEFDAGAGTWQACAFMDADISASGRADVKWNGSELFVLSYTSNPKLFKYTYDPTWRTWNLMQGFPVSLPVTGGNETMVLDQDTTGRLWTTWEGGNNIWVAWSTNAAHTSWSEPFSLRSGVDSDDISSVVAFGTRIGVFWSDQKRDEFAFRIHRDGNAPDDWESIEIADAGDGHADDHICIKASADGTVFALTKDDHDKMFLHRRQPDGSWDTADDVISGTGTRGSLMICDDSKDLYVAYTSWSSASNKIKLRRGSYSRMDFSTYISELISGGTFNNATGCKQVLPEGVYMGMAGGEGDTWWNGWGELPPDGPPPPDAPGSLTALLQEETRKAPAAAQLCMNLTLDEGAGDTITGTSHYAHEGHLDGIAGKATTGPVWTSGWSGTALQFDGDDWVLIESAPDLEIESSFTLEVWLRRNDDANGDGTILSKGPSQHRNYHLMLLENGRIDFKWEVAGGDNRGVTSTSSLTAGQWQHVTCIYDAANGVSKLYIDGQLDAAAADSGTPVTNDEPLYLGRRISGTTPRDYLSASLDGIRIWRGVAYHGDFEPGPMPALPRGAESDHRVQLHWTRPQGEEGDIVYSIAMRYNSTGLFSLASNLSSTSWTHNAPVFGTMCYEIRATRLEDGRISQPARIFVEYHKPHDRKKTPLGDPQVASSTPVMSASLQASPNPFNPRTTVQLHLPQAGRVDLAIYDVRGRRVCDLHHGALGAGTHRFDWNARSDRGESLASGVYFLRGDIPGEVFRQRLVLLK